MAYRVRFWVLLISFWQSQDVYQLFEKINEQVQAEITNLARPGDLCSLDLYIYPWKGQVEPVRKISRPLLIAGPSLVPVEE
jgi:hypothetical protein